MKETQYSLDARKKLLAGAQIIAKAVKVTLGPSGRNVLIRNAQENRPFSTKDGVTVAGQIASKDPIEMIAIESLQDIANNTDDKAGDGTTTATVIAEAILNMGIEFPEELNALDIKRGIDETVQTIVGKLAELSRPIENNLDMLRKVALVSSNYDDEAADIVTKAFKVAGRQGIVNIKRSYDGTTHMTAIEGMALPMGYRSKYYVNNHENDTCILEEPYVFMTNKKINKMNDNLEYLLNQCAENSKALLIITPGIDPMISDMLIQNVQRAGFKCCVANSPGFGNDQEELLKDLGAVLGKSPFLENDALQFEDLPKEEILSSLPQSKEVTIGEQMSSIKGAFGLDEEEEIRVEKEMDDRANNLREKLKSVTQSYEKSVLQTRISRLSDGIAYINIGANSDSEYIEKQGRVQDALYSVKSANEEGIIPGGGAALLSLSKMEFGFKSKNPSKEYGSQILMKAIQQPFFQIIENVGIKVSPDVIDIITDNFNHGINAKTEKYSEDLIEEGVIDPVKVTRVALEAAASIAGMILTTECVIVDTDVYKKEPQQPY